MRRTIYGLSLILVACGGEDRGSPVVDRGSDSAASADTRHTTPDSRPTTPDTRPTTPDSRPTILFLGTSLTAGLGVDPDSAYPAIIQRKLDSAGIGLEVINGGVSGETSAAALRRVPFVLRGNVAALVVETGANDGLRGLDPDSTRANIEAIIGAVRARDSTIRMVLAGMEAPPNMGPRFTARFRAMYPELARAHGLPLIPFILQGVGGVAGLNQADGIHPTPAGHRIVAENVWRVLYPAIRGMHGMAE